MHDTIKTRKRSASLKFNACRERTYPRGPRLSANTTCDGILGWNNGTDNSQGYHGGKATWSVSTFSRTFLQEKRVCCCPLAHGLICDRIRKAVSERGFGRVRVREGSADTYDYSEPIRVLESSAKICHC
jgi:hypothetical protein